MYYIFQLASLTAWYQTRGMWVAICTAALELTNVRPGLFSDLTGYSMQTVLNKTGYFLKCPWLWVIPKS